MFVTVQHQPETLDFSVVTLDDPDAVPPEYHIFWSSKIAWFRLPSAVDRSQHSRIRSTVVVGKNLGSVESDQLGTVGTQAARSVAITPRCRR